MKSPTKTLEAQIANLVHNFEFLHGKKVISIELEHKTVQLASNYDHKTVKIFIKAEN